MLNTYNRAFCKNSSRPKAVKKATSSIFGRVLNKPLGIGIVRKVPDITRSSRLQIFFKMGVRKNVSNLTKNHVFFTEHLR